MWNFGKLSFVFFCMSFILLTACKEDAKNTVKATPVAFTKEGELTLYKAAKDTALTKLDIEIADSEYETQTGLMHRTSMNENQGMLFIFPDIAVHSFYMKNTQIPLDIIFVDQNLKVVHIQENTVPFSETGISSNVPVQYVLEINAGLVEKWGVEIGDRIEYTK